MNPGTNPESPGFSRGEDVNRQAWENAVAWDADNGGLQDESGRLWDVMWMASLAARRAQPESDRIRFTVYRVENRAHQGAPRPVPIELELHIGPGDTPEPVMTVMEPGED